MAELVWYWWDLKSQRQDASCTAMGLQMVVKISVDSGAVTKLMEKQHKSAFNRVFTRHWAPNFSPLLPSQTRRHLVPTHALC